jgi:chemotaxis protein CheZ
MGMASVEHRKPFWVERRGMDAPPTNPLPDAGHGEHDAHTGSETALAALRDEISALRSEVAGLSRALETQPAAAPAPPVMTQEAPATASGQQDVLAVQWEIARLVKSIGQAKSEIAAIRHPMSDDDRLGAASSELDAIVKATEVATNDILTAAEAIELESVNIAGLCNDNHEALNASERIVGHVMAILEACNFQDITGQRINKVVQTVHFIETRVGAMIDIWGAEAFCELPVPEARADGSDSEADLLNGPQLANEGISQADIDALFD